MKSPDIALLSKFLVPVNIESARMDCVDDRSEGGSGVVRLYGGTSAIVDLAKKHAHLTECDAWRAVQEAGIPLRVHEGPIHGKGIVETLKRMSVYKLTGEPSGPLGCGYAALVETNPGKVGAVEKANASQRLQVVVASGGSYYSVYGHHQIDYAVEVKRPGYTLDYDLARQEGIGLLVNDTWAVDYYLKLLKRSTPRLTVNKDTATISMSKNFGLVVNRLAPHLSVQQIT